MEENVDFAVCVLRSPEHWMQYAEVALEAVEFVQLLVTDLKRGGGDVKEGGGGGKARGMRVRQDTSNYKRKPLIPFK